MSSFHFHRVFTRLVGITPKAYAKQLREQQSRETIGTGRSITEAIHDTGYGSATRFYEGASKRLGMSPRRLRERGAGQTIHYATARTSIGVLLVASNDLGVCAIEIGDTEDAVLSILKDRFAHAERILDTDALADHLRAIVASIDDPHRTLDLPLDIAGTAFQQPVWSALRRQVLAHHNRHARSRAPARQTNWLLPFPLTASSVPTATLRIIAGVLRASGRCLRARSRSSRSVR